MKKWLCFRHDTGATVSSVFWLLAGGLLAFNFLVPLSPWLYFSVPFIGAALTGTFYVPEKARVNEQLVLDYVLRELRKKKFGLIAEEDAIRSMPAPLRMRKY